MMKIKIKQLAMSVMAMCALNAIALSAYAESVAVPTAAGSYIPLGANSVNAEYVTMSGDGKLDNSNNPCYVVGSTKSGYTLTIAVNNSTAGDAVLAFLSGAKSLTAEGTVTVANTSGYSVSKAMSFSDTGAWSPSERHYLYLKALPAGELTVTLAITSTTGSYAGNYGSFGIYAADSARFIAPPTAEGAYQSIQNGVDGGAITLTSCGVDNSNDGKTIGSTGDNTKIEMALCLDETAKYGFSYYSGSDGYKCNLNWTLLDADGTQVWPASGVSTDAIDNTSSWNLTESHVHDFGSLAEGVYILKAYVSDRETDGGNQSYAGNYGNFAFTKESLTKYTVTVPSVDHATVTVTGASATETAGVYSAASNVTVTVTYAADAGYEFAGEQQSVWTFENISADQTIAAAPTATVAAMYVEEGALEWNDSGDLVIAGENNSSVSLILNSTNLTVSGRLLMARGSNGGGQNSRATFTMNGGSFSAAGAFFGWNAGSVSTFRQNGGAIDLSAAFEPGWGGSTTSIVQIAGGTFAATAFNPGNYGNSRTEMTVSGGEVTISGDARLHNQSSHAGYVKLTIAGGVFAAKRFYTNATGLENPSDIILDGGTLRAVAASTDFIEDDEFIAFAIGSNGGTIDTRSYAITIPAAVSGTGVALVKAGSGTLTFTNASLFSGTITVPEGCGSVVVPLSASITAGDETKVVEDETTKTFSYDAPVIPEYSFTNGATNDTAISGTGYITLNNAYLNADLSEFTGTIYVNGDVHILAGFSGAPKATWVVNGGIYLYDDDKTKTAATSLKFGSLSGTSRKRFYMNPGAQDCTIEVGALGEDDEYVANTGIGGHYWNGTAKDDASVTVKKVGSGKFTTNLVGARKWNITEGEVEFVPLTEEEVATSGCGLLMYVTNVNEMVVAAGATVGGYYGTLASSGLHEYNILSLSMASGAIFAPTAGGEYGWTVKGAASIDGVKVAPVNCGSCIYNRRYAILTAETLTGTPVLADGVTDFTISIEGNTLYATYTGWCPYTIATGETLTYTGRVTDSSSHEDTDLGIIIEDGGRLVVDVKTMGFPGCDGTKASDGSITLPKITLPEGKTFKECVRIIAPDHYTVHYAVTADGYGYVYFTEGRSGVVIIYI